MPVIRVHVSRNVTNNCLSCGSSFTFKCKEKREKIRLLKSEKIMIRCEGF